MTRRGTLTAIALYVVLAIGMWPLSSKIDREFAWDLGDPVLNAWILQWTGGQVLGFLTGDAGALSATGTATSSTRNR